MSEESDLKRLCELSPSELRPQFAEAMAAIRRSALSRVAPKQILGSTMSAAMLATMASSYVEAINGGAVPDIRKSWDQVVVQALRAALERGSAVLLPALRGRATASPLPSRDAIDAVRSEIDGGGAATVAEPPLAPLVTLRSQSQPPD